jgi:hypothetical protein
MRIPKGSSHGGNSGMIFGVVAYMHTCLGRHLGMSITYRASGNLSVMSLLSLLLNLKRCYRIKVSKASFRGICAITDMSELKQV